MTRPGDGRGAARLAGLIIALSLLASVGAAQTPAVAPNSDVPVAPRDYVEGFCLPLAGGYVPDAETPRFLREWDARPGSASGADGARPVDAPAPGQAILFADKAAPATVLETRRGVCSLIWPGATLPPAALSALVDGRPPVGAKGAPVAWIRITPVYGKAPPPPKYLLRIGGSEDRGVCAERREDLRLRDGSPVSMLQLSPCRLGPGESLPAR